MEVEREKADEVLMVKVTKTVAKLVRETAREGDRTISGQLRRIVTEWADRTTMQGGA